MIWSYSFLIYILLLLADVTLVAFAYFAGARRRWLPWLALGLNTVPVVLAILGLASTLDAMRTNADAGLALIAGPVIAAPFLACFVVCVLLFFRRRKARGSENKTITQGADR